MKVYLSGQAETLAEVRGNVVVVSKLDDINAEKEQYDSALPFIFGGTSDLEVVTVSNKSIAIQMLELSWKKDRSIRMINTLLEADLDLEIRLDAASCLEELLDEKVENHILNIYFTEPLPFECDLKETLNIVQHHAKLFKLFKKIESNQFLIRKFSEAWHELPVGVFEDGNAKNEFRGELIKRGLLKKLILSVNNSNEWGMVEFECYSILKKMPNARKIISRWLINLKPITNVNCFDLCEEVNKECVSKTKEKRYKKRVNIHETITCVKKQKQAIIQLMKENKQDKMRRFIDELVSFQLRKGDPVFTAKSLCDLAQEAKKVKYFSLQLELSKWATEVAPEDSWSFGQLGDAHFCLGQFDDALKAYEKSRVFGDWLFAESGKARILRNQGCFEEAIEIYNKLIFENNKDYHYWVGKAECYREISELETAIEIYKEAIVQCPDEGTLYCAKAAILKDMGLFQESIDEYDKAIKLFSEPIAYCGRSDVFKQLGLYSEALKQYEKVIENYPDYVIAYCSSADIFKINEKYSDAIKLYDEAIDKFPYDSSPWQGKAEIFSKLGEYENATNIFNEAILKFPYDSRLRNSFGNMYKNKSEYENALQIYEACLRRFPYDYYAMVNRAEVLKKTGYLKEAVEAYNDIIKRNEYKYGAIYSKAAVLVALDQYEEAEKLVMCNDPKTHDEWIAFHIRGMIFLKKNKLKDAINQFSYGFKNTPFQKEKTYFKNALAIANLKKRQVDVALAYIESDDDEPISKIIELHILGENNRREDAKKVFDSLKDCPIDLIELRDELAGKYGIVSGHPRYDEEWIFKKECLLLTLEAA